MNPIQKYQSGPWSSHGLRSRLLLQLQGEEKQPEDGGWRKSQSHCHRWLPICCLHLSFHCCEESFIDDRAEYRNHTVMCSMVVVRLLTLRYALQIFHSCCHRSFTDRVTK